ncbi:MAG TPA: ComEC/Rec2 family competence protein, partial [Lachnospiraceae bacterium]|nr:ComEC/Rec2 family competence protein [Lachnospiraceae bacterium]
YTLLRKLSVPPAITSFISILLIISYAIMTDYSVSTNRAVVMLIVSILAKLIGRTYDNLSGIALSALIILVQSPLQIYSSGFLLTFAAVLSLAILNQQFKKVHDRKEEKEAGVIPYGGSAKLGVFLDFIGKELRSSLAATIGTLPIIIYFYYEFPTYAVFLNLIVIPFSSMLLLLGIVGGIIGLFHIGFAKFIIGGCFYILKIYEELCSFFSRLPYHQILVGRPGIVNILLYYLILGLLIFLIVSTKRKLIYVMIAMLWVVLFRYKDKDLQIALLDVGQGDGIVMQAPNGITYMIDGGSTSVSKVGTYRIIPYLKAMRVRQIDYAIVTHTDADHINGLKEIIENMGSSLGNGIGYQGYIEINHLVMPDTSAIDESYTELVDLAKSKGIPVLYIRKGDYFQNKELLITCLHPYPQYIPASKNDYSTVLSISYNEFQAILTGDLESSGEEQVMEAIKEYERINPKAFKDYDFIKIAHHGSKYTTGEEFLRKIDAEYALISCGFGNSYGHPHGELLQRLREDSMDTLITMEEGA